MSDEQTRKTYAIRGMLDALGRNISVAGLSLWSIVLRDIPAALVEQGVVHYLASSESEYATPSKFRQFLLRMQGRGIPDTKAAAALAWEKLIKAITDYGSYNCPELPEATARVVESMGGWGAVCQWTNSQLEFKRREFVEAWRAIQETSPEPQGALPEDGRGVLTSGASHGGQQCQQLL